MTLIYIAPSTEVKENALTLEAIIKHDARQAYAGGKVEPTVNDIAASMKSFNFNGVGNGDDDDDMAESQLGCTFKTYQTFASNYSSCTNMSFNKYVFVFTIGFVDANIDGFFLL